MHRRSSHHMAVLLAAAQAMFYAQMVFKQPYHNSVFYQMLQSNPECCHIPSFLQDLGELPTQSTPLAPYIANNPKLFPFFKGALGALDGTHISACPPSSDQSCYHNHKGGVSQNVLAATTFNMHFFLHPQWMGWKCLRWGCLSWCTSSWLGDPRWKVLPKQM